MLKFGYRTERNQKIVRCFSTLQRVEIAEMVLSSKTVVDIAQVSVLFNESKLLKSPIRATCCCSAWVSVLFNESKLLKLRSNVGSRLFFRVSVLFNESKLLKCRAPPFTACGSAGFSTLQRVEIAEIGRGVNHPCAREPFQYSSTSRNC